MTEIGPRLIVLPILPQRPLGSPLPVGAVTATGEAFKATYEKVEEL